MRIRAMENGGTTDVKILMKHDMETGQRKDASGKGRARLAHHQRNGAAQRQDGARRPVRPGRVEGSSS